jgi:hypothetical protein
MGRQLLVEFSAVTLIAASCDNASMPILFIVLIVLVVLSFGGGMAQPRYRRHGVSLGTVLLIVLLLWLFGAFGSRPF